MTKHRARTAQQIEDAARQGEQNPCGLIADHQYRYGHKHTCQQCTDHRERMTRAYNQGVQDATERAALYSADQIEQEKTNAVQAYCNVPPIEPAVSYLVGYVGGLERAYSEQHPHPDLFPRRAS